MKWYHNQFEFRKDKGIMWIHFENCVEFARLVASMNNTELFNDIFDSYNMFFTNGHYAAEASIFCQSEYLEIMLDNDGLFNSIFEISLTYHTINPIINNCLRHALKHLDKYKHRAMDILKFGINYNRGIADEISFNDCYICNELGGLKNFRNGDYYDIVIFVDVEVNDDED
ncbi:MAG: hypothetical protein NC331_15110 [Lachnospiraceae bacterium]|nr:hypothetical protein [Lachnospiraceae bacterium]MCM1240690.1 hypothetical protein [Lachnospiraceae bacterium]